MLNLTNHFPSLKPNPARKTAGNKETSQAVQSPRKGSEKNDEGILGRFQLSKKGLRIRNGSMKTIQP